MKLRSVFLILASILTIIVLLIAIGVSPIEATKLLFSYGLGSPRAISGTLAYATPILICAVAVYLALRAGLFNIGVEGQLLVGAMVATACALKFPNAFGSILAIILGSIAGALWALPAGLIKAYRGGHEVITTIMLNSVAIYFTAAVVVGPLRDTKQEGPSSSFISESTRIPAIVNIESTHLMINMALIIGIGILLAYNYWLKRTVSGYELDVTGENPVAARFAGISVSKNIVRAMILSGSIAGFAGALQVLAYQGRFFQGFSPGYGFDGLGVAILAGSNPLGILLGALLFGALNKGSGAIQFFGVPKGLSSVILGLLIVCFAAYRYRRIRTDD